MASSVVVTGRYPRLLVRDREPLGELARRSSKPILMWSYNEPAEACIALLREAGYPLFASVRNCTRAMRATAVYRATRERFLLAGARTEGT